MGDRLAGDSLSIIQCKTEFGKGTSCTIDGVEVKGGLAEAIKEGRKIADEQGTKVYYRNTSFDCFRPLEEFLKACPKLKKEIELDKKIKLLKISAVLLFGIALAAYLLTIF